MGHNKGSSKRQVQSTESPQKVLEWFLTNNFIAHLKSLEKSLKVVDKEIRWLKIMAIKIRDENNEVETSSNSKN